jgi:calcineurin-like phosphoesterase family protein
VIQLNKPLRSKFRSVTDYRELKLDGINVVLFHFPMLEWNRMHHGAFALFGHVHGNMDHYPNILSARTMDVGIDSRPGGIEPKDGIHSLWEWSQIKEILMDRPIRKHHNRD